MRNHQMIVTIILWLKALCNCTPQSRILMDKNVSRYKSYNKEPVAVSHLIQKYELEHLELFKKEVNKSGNLEWRDLENKDLNDFCRKYLYHCVSGRSVGESTGSTSIMKLRYKYSGYEVLRINIVVVTCIKPLSHKLAFHLTRALDSNCVYALSKSSGGCGLAGIFTIIYKHCGFEENSSRKRKRLVIKEPICEDRNNDDEFKRQCKRTDSHSKHRRTGQLIADDESIMKYELEHQEMHENELIKGSSKIWHFMMQHPNLNKYCYKYLNACIPSRCIEGAEGYLRLGIVQWRTNKEVLAEVIVVQCYKRETNRSYYFTSALCPNCVYALLRDGKVSSDRFLIIFKHCNFDLPKSNQESLENFEADDQNFTHHEQVKTEDLPVKTYQLFPNN